MIKLFLSDLPHTETIIYGTEVSEGHLQDPNEQQWLCTQSLGFLDM